jgi:adenosylcobinamide-phosphate guanylyltransferase
MTVTALVMAGGKGTRMALAEEKPLLRVGGNRVISLVLKALQGARTIDTLVVAVSDSTPKTASYLADFSIKVLKTPGKDFVSDMGYAVKKLKLQTVLAIAADMPLLTPEIIDEIVERYISCGKPALAVAVPLETKRKIGMSLDYAFDFEGKSLVPAGVNVNDGQRIDDEEMVQEIYVMDNVEVAVNINTVEELEVANMLFCKLNKTLT